MSRTHTRALILATLVLGSAFLGGCGDQTGAGAPGGAAGTADLGAGGDTGAGLGTVQRDVPQDTGGGIGGEATRNAVGSGDSSGSNAFFDGAGRLADSLIGGGNQDWARVDPTGLGGGGTGAGGGAPTRSFQGAQAGTDTGPGAPTSGSGSPQGDRIAQVAERYVGMRNFPYDRATNGGRLGCAQVITQILKDAGVLDRISLGVLETISMLKDKGFRNVSPPPWKNGDVVTWATYDRTGDGRIDPDTHIGIIQVVNGVPYAVNNSSNQKKPVKVALANFPARISHVLRGS